MSLEDQRLLAATFFPNEWAASTKIAYGETRRRRQKSLRDRAVYHAITFPLIQRGENCGSCRYRVDGNCDAQSDFHGYVPVAADAKLCQDWTAR